MTSKLCGISGASLIGQLVKNLPAMRVHKDFPGDPVARLHTLNAGGPGLIAGQGTRSHMLHPKIPHAARKIKDPVCHN